MPAAKYLLITWLIVCDGPTLEFWASLVAQRVKNLPSIQETWVRFLGWEDLLEKGMATRSSNLASPGESPRTKKPGGLHSLWGRKELDTPE